MISAKNKRLISLVLVVILAVLLIVLAFLLVPQTKNISNYDETCRTQLQGIWLPDTKECVNVQNATACATYGGEFNDCASPCRNDLAASTCIQHCVQLCQF